jgi:hypothetical protein
MIAAIVNEGAGNDVVTLIRPQSNDGTVIQSTTVYADRLVSGQGKMYLSAKLFASAGAVSGAPSALSFPFKLQHSDATGSGWGDYTDPVTGSVPTVTITAQNTEGEVAVNLSAAKKYLRVYVDGVFTDGSSPELLVCAGVVLSGSTRVPV